MDKIKGICRLRNGMHNCAIALCLVMVMLTGILTGCGNGSLLSPDQDGQRGRGGKDIVSGRWKLAGDDDILSGSYIYKLDSPLIQCSGLSIDYEVNIVEGVSCDRWTLYGRSYGEWYDLGTMELSYGRGSQTFTISPAMDIDALTTYPDVDGDLEWEEKLTVYDAVFGEQSGSSYGENGTWVEGDWTEQRYDVNNVNTSAFQLRTPIYNCRNLKVEIDVDMKYNTSCKDWKVYTWDGVSWVPIGDIYMPSGNGEAEANIRLSSAMTIEYLIIVPKAPGSYSWDCAISVYDMN